VNDRIEEYQGMFRGTAKKKGMFRKYDGCRQTMQYIFLLLILLKQLPLVEKMPSIPVCKGH
jgi:hypothetical protein